MPKTTNSPSATLAVDLRVGKLASALVSNDGSIIAESYRDFDGESAKTVASAMAAAIFSQAADRKRGDYLIKAIGITARHSSLASVEPLISKELSRGGVDIRRPAGAKEARADKDAVPHPRLVVNSRQVAAIAGEAWVGAAKGLRNAVALTLGDVIEAGLLVEGQIVRGASGRAGAVGWLALSERWREEFSVKGCFNIEAGRQSLVRRAIESWSGTGNSLLDRMSSADLTPETIFRSALAGDSMASRVISDLLEWISRGIAGLISTLNPEIVILRGALGLELRPFMPELRKMTKQWSQPEAFRGCRITVSTLGPRGVLIGAARLAMS